MNTHLLTFGVIWALVAIFLAFILFGGNTKPQKEGILAGPFIVVGIFGFLAVICFLAYFSSESSQREKRQQDREQHLEWERKEELKRTAKASMPVGDEASIKYACKKGRDRVLADIYVGMLIDDLTVDDEFQISGSKVTVTVRLKLLTENAKKLRESGYIERKVGAGVEYKYKKAFEEAGLKEPIVVSLITSLK